MEKQFWAAIQEHQYALPEGHSALELTEELFTYLGSTDPELRDTIGLEIFYNWLQQGLYTPEQVRAYITRLLANLPLGLGGAGDDSVFRRSFSALWLALIIQKDTAAPFLEREELMRILEALLAYFVREVDLRGYVPVKGFAHAGAHAADVLTSLARSPHTAAADHRRILICIADRLRDGAPGIYLYNEDGRMARVAHAVLFRNLLPLEQFKDWLAYLSRDWNGAWQSEAGTRAYFNGRNLLRALHWFILTGKAEPIPAQEAVLKLIQETLDEARPWVWDTTAG